MSNRCLFSRERLLFCCLLAAIPALVASTAPAEPTRRVGPSWGVERIRAQAREGEVVALQGHVVSISRKRFFTLEDAEGERIVAVIPEHLQREIGQPETGETIRVRGKYDHKTFLDVGKSTKSAPDKTWGIRVSAVDRNVASSGRNPKHVNGVTQPPTAGASGGRTVPAAPSGVGSIATPNTPQDLKARLSAARQRAMSAKKTLEEANAELARGHYRNAEGAELDELSANQQRAQQNFDAAATAIDPLVEEAREAGLDPKSIELFEAGVTKPGR